MTIRLFAVALVSLSAVSLSAQASAQPACSAADARAVALAEALLADGFERVGVCAEGTRARVTFENRRYRYDVRALEEVAEAARWAGLDRLQLVPTRSGVALASIETEVPAEGAALDPESTTAGFASSTDLPPTQRGPWLKLDAVLHPVIRAEFGDFDTPVRADVELNPTLQTALWPGAAATAQLVVPVLSDVQGSDGSVRPGILALHQRARLGTVFARLSAGRFTRDRYGVDAQATAFVLDGRLALTGRIGQTGFGRLNDGRIDYTALNQTTYSVGLEAVALPRYGLTVGAEVERFLSGATGVRAELGRVFDETRVAFFGTVVGDELGTLADGDPNVGGRITFALPIAKHARPGRVRARLADRMAIEYRYRRLGEGTPAYDVEPGPQSELGAFHPALLEARLRRR